MNLAKKLFVIVLLALICLVAIMQFRRRDAEIVPEDLEYLRQYGAVIVFSDTASSKIDTVTFTNDRVVPELIQVLSRLGPLREIDLDASPKFGDDCLRAISRKTEVQVLKLGGTGITDASLSHLNELKSLRSLYLWRTRVTDVGLNELRLPNLEVLNLWDTDTTNLVVESLISKLPKLKQVCLGASPRPDSIFQDDWDIPSPRISAGCIARLRRNRPDLKVVFWAPNDDVERPSMTRDEIPSGYKTVRSSDSGDLSEPSPDDWGRFLGPTANGKSLQTTIRTDWGQTAPELIWSRVTGEGLSSPVASAERIIFTHRLGNEEIVECLNLYTGDQIWSAKYKTTYRDPLGYSNGPRSSPVIDGDRVYLFSADGVLQCVSFRSGERIWRVDANSTFLVEPNLYGVGSTPTIFGNLLLVVVGGVTGMPGDQDSDAGIVAFDKRTGKVAYTLSSTFASYASIQVTQIGEQAVAYAFMREGLVAFDPTNGKELAFYPWAAKVSGCVNGATPVVEGGNVFISEAYGPGSALLSLAENELKTVWRDPRRSRKRSLRAHWATPILHDGYLYGCSGRHSSDGKFKCIQWDTGKTIWTYDQRCLSSVCFADGHLINLCEDGAIYLIEATPRMYRPIARFRPTVTGSHAKPGDDLLLKYPAWAGPIISNGMLFVRGKDRIAALKID